MAATRCWAAVGICALMAGCGQSQADSSRSVDTEPEPGPPRLELVADVPGAVGMVAHPVTGDLYINDVGGHLLRVTRDDSGYGQPEELLDFSGRISNDWEQGLLGVAIDPAGENIYLNFTDTEGASQVVGWELNDGRPDPGTERHLLELPQPDFTHNGGHMIVDDEGMLWIAFGDGSAPTAFVDGTSHWAQDTTNLHGSLLRIDPRPDGGDPYRIPPDNPFVDDPGARDEIWAYGLRNPWRFHFDSLTGDLWIADVGAHDREEINHAAAADGLGRGANYGWDIWEGTRRHSEGEVADHRPPLLELDHDDGYCAVIGGPTYRGTELPDLYGQTLFSDFCDLRLAALRILDAGEVEVTDLGISLPGIVAFATGIDDEVYAISMLDGVFALTPG